MGSLNRSSGGAMISSLERHRGREFRVSAYALPILRASSICSYAAANASVQGP
jgi:hypothetical protein